jgi:hypothetical protein
MEIFEHIFDDTFYKYYKNYFRYLPKKDIYKLRTFLITKKLFTREELTTSKKFYQYNKSKFDKNNNFLIKQKIFDRLCLDLISKFSITDYYENMNKNYILVLGKNFLTNKINYYVIDKNHINNKILKVENNVVVEETL